VSSARVAVVVRVGNGATPFSAQTATTAAATAAGSNTSSLPAAGAGPGIDSSSSSSAGTPQQQQEGPDSVAHNTWEEEIEETLKLVQLLPPSGVSDAAGAAEGGCLMVHRRGGLEGSKAVQGSV
jgi:hypothetical protein